jgi:hypothetical protein
MKKICFPILLLLVAFQLSYSNGVFPDFFGAKSLSLGMGSRGFNLSINSMHINPALIGAFKGSMTGYQFMNSSRSMDGFEGRLKGLLASNFKTFNSLSRAEKSLIISDVKGVLDATMGLYGFSGHFPGMILGNYGISTSIYSSAVIRPIINSNFSKSDQQINQQDINSLQFQILGFKFKNYSFSYALDMSAQIQIGATFHYITGKYREFKRYIGSSFFSNSSKRAEYLSQSWENPGKELRCINIDLGLSVDMGRFFRFGAIMKNVNTPKLVKSRSDFELERVVLIGFAFKPELSWEISADFQLNESNMFLSEKKVQPVSFGVEKGFFKNKMFVRLGIMSYINDEYLIGAKSNMVLTMGSGFNIGNFVFNFGAGFDRDGMLNSLAVSGFVMVQ